jgi:hypothetical protein
VVGLPMVAVTPSWSRRRQTWRYSGRVVRYRRDATGDTSAGPACWQPQRPRCGVSSIQPFRPVTAQLLSLIIDPYRRPASAGPLKAARQAATPARALERRTASVSTAHESLILVFVVTFTRVPERSRAARARRNRPAPTMVAHRFDHAPITDRSHGQRFLQPSITRHSGCAAAAGLSDGIPRRDPAALACRGSPVPALGREPLVSAESSPRSTASSTREPGQEHPARDRAAAPLRPHAHPASVRSGLQVRVAASAGPAPPPATCGQPQAPPVSA